MRFPPPVRYYAPLLVLVCGLAATWLDYELNLADDLSRNLKYVQAQADATGERLARRSAKQIERFEPVSLTEDVVARPRQPWLKAVALVDESGVAIDDSDKQWVGHLARETALAPAMKLAVNADENAGNRQSRSADGAMLFGAYPFAMGPRETGWALVIFDRGDAVAQASADARGQLRLAAAAITLVCLCLWATTRRCSGELGRRSAYRETVSRPISRTVYAWKIVSVTRNYRTATQYPMTYSTISIPISADDSWRPRLLVVNENPLTRELHTLVLNLEGYDVETACDGAAALERLAVEQFDAVVTNRAMPNLDGASMVLALRSAGSEVPIVMVSGSLSEAPLLRLVACEISAVAPKPARTNEILSAVAHALRASAARREDLELARRSHARKESGQNVVEFMERL